MITLDLNKDKVIQIGEDKEHDSIIVMLEDEEFIQLQKQVNYYTDKVSLLKEDGIRPPRSKRK
tara:strand:+ start:1275 stop:1463 length:189 start_codon:yes stop_codon:yes gene_type:complete